MGNEQRLPNLVIAGVGKSGTTSLFHYLGQHPEICAATVKEVKHFEPLRYGRPPGAIEEYARHFSHCGGQRYRLEATPTYCHGGPPLIAAIKDTLEDPRIIINLRDPGERLWDSFWYMKSRHLLGEDLSFEEYLDECLRLRAAGVDREEPHRFYRLSTGFYCEFIGQWITAFGDRLRIVFFDQLVADPAATLRELCGWLELDPEPIGSFEFSIHNPTNAYRSRRLHAIVLAVNHAGRRVLAAHPAARGFLRRLYDDLNATTRDTAPSAEVQQRLRQLFRESNQRTASQLTANGYTVLPSWLREP